MGKKKKIIILVTSIVIVAAIALLLIYKKQEKAKWAEENYKYWQSVYDMTKMMDEKFVQANYRKFLTVPRWYEDYSCDDLNTIEPHVSKKFMTEYYERLFAQLTWKHGVVVECWEDGQQVLGEMNQELNEISSYVITEIESGAPKTELIEDDSKLYRTVQKKLATFCDAHTKNVDDFFERLEKKELEIESTGECSKWKIEMRAENVTSTGMTLILTRDNPEEDARILITGEMYFLQKKKKNEWVSVQPILDEYGWYMIATLIDPVGTREWEIDWEWLYGKLSAGTYRIGKNVQIDGNYMLADNVGYNKTYYAEFQIE